MDAEGDTAGAVRTFSADSWLCMMTFSVRRDWLHCAKEGACMNAPEFFNLYDGMAPRTVASP